jgi:hypothetical protein
MALLLMIASARRLTSSLSGRLRGLICLADRRLWVELIDWVRELREVFQCAVMRYYA